MTQTKGYQTALVSIPRSQDGAKMEDIEHYSTHYSRAKMEDKSTSVCAEIPALCSETGAATVMT